MGETAAGGGLVGATYVALGEHISGSLAGATYRVALGGHISGRLAGATYRVALAGHIYGGLAGATHGQRACMCGVQGCAGISQRGPLHGPRCCHCFWDNSFPPTRAHGALVFLAGAWGSLRLSQIFLGLLVVLSGFYLASPELSWCVLGLSSGCLGVF